MPSLWADSLDEHRELVLGKVLSAYEALRAEVGVEAVTLTAVAQRAGIARSALYNYVKDKHGLVLLHAERTMGGATQQLQACLLSDEDLLLGKDHWASFADPFPEWQVAAETAD